MSSKIVANHTDGKHRPRRTERTLMGYSLADVRVGTLPVESRRIELPHPVAYSNLVETIGRLWESDIAPAINTDVAQFTVRQHSDGRIASMEQSRPHLRPGGTTLSTRADIAAFYDSIYSHAIPWALMGKPEAKLNHRLSVPANELDAAVRDGSPRRNNRHLCRPWIFLDHRGAPTWQS
ncbi:hypothetical protein JM654_23495 [Microbacterium oxydans]|nr:hypothetical protein [Microbacterium oxydans]